MPKTMSINQKIYDDLRADIASGKLAPGAIVPSLNQLMSTYSCSMGTARHAIVRLRDEKVVETGMGRPTRVIGLPPTERPTAPADPIERIAAALEALVEIQREIYKKL